jgi:hypothetical protein
MKLEIDKEYTTLRDTETLNEITNAVNIAIVFITNKLKLEAYSSFIEKQELFNLLVNEIHHRIRSIGMEHYNVIVGDNFSNAIRYKQKSLAVYSWGIVRVLVFSCPVDPSFPLEHNIDTMHSASREDLIKSMKVIREYINFNKITLDKLKSALCGTLAAHLSQSYVNVLIEC